MREHKINDNVIGLAGWYMEDTSLCDDIIKYHENDPDRAGGVVGIGDTQEYLAIDKKRKNSIDSWFKPQGELFERYNEHLKDVLDQFKKKYDFCQWSAPWYITENVNIQKYYAPDGGFPMWHCERSAKTTSDRWLVFMTYLNDVEHGGETDFYYQKVKVKPEKGLTLIWSCDWTHTHRGNYIPFGEKYIVTGWFTLQDPSFEV